MRLSKIRKDVFALFHLHTIIAVLAALVIAVTPCGGNILGYGSHQALAVEPSVVEVIGFRTHCFVTSETVNDSRGISRRHGEPSAASLRIGRNQGRI